MLLECVPNFSEGRDMSIIRRITDQIEAVDGVKLLDVDPGASTHRTVVTFVGPPDAVVEAAFQAIKKASELIDMRRHKGTHPRMGATDVCPLIPIDGISEEAAVRYAHDLAQRVGEELQIPVYLYEAAAQEPRRRNLATIRAGEYEGFAEKILRDEWKPDYGPRRFNETAGQTVIGVRDFLVAYNINLNTRSVRRTNSVAFDIREKGRVKTEDGTPWGKKVLDEKGQPVREPGSCKHVKAIGWYVDEYGIAQVSANLTNINETPVHEVFEAARRSANERGLRVTGSELVGLIPKKSLVEAGRYYLRQQGVSEGASERELVDLAVKSLGLDELGPFDPQQKVIEYALAADRTDRLGELSVHDLLDRVASDVPAPGGGSVAALVGALGAALGAMVGNLSGNKRGWDDRTPEFGSRAYELQQIKSRLRKLVDEDTDAFNAVMAAYRLPKSSEAERIQRRHAIEEANLRAAESPLAIATSAAKAYPILAYLAEHGNPNSITDVGVGAHCIHAAIEGSALNVRINLPGLDDPDLVRRFEEQISSLQSDSARQRNVVLEHVERVMRKA